MVRKVPQCLKFLFIRAHLPRVVWFEDMFGLKLVHRVHLHVVAAKDVELLEKVYTGIYF